MPILERKLYQHSSDSSSIQLTCGPFHEREQTNVPDGGLRPDCMRTIRRTFEQLERPRPRSLLCDKYHSWIEYISVNLGGELQFVPGEKNRMIPMPGIGEIGTGIDSRLMPAETVE